MMDDKPRVRPIEAFPVQQDGKTLIYLKDPLNFATPLGISPVGYFLLAHFDGHIPLPIFKKPIASSLARC